MSSYVDIIVIGGGGGIFQLGEGFLRYSLASLVLFSRPSFPVNIPEITISFTKFLLTCQGLQFNVQLIPIVPVSKDRFSHNK